MANVAVGCEMEMRGVSGVQFVPLQVEWVDMVVRKTPSSRLAIRQLKDIFEGDRLLRDMESLQPCDTSRLGSIVYES